MPKAYTIEQFNAQLETGAYAWPGGYPIYFLAADGEALSFSAAQENAELIRSAMSDGFNPQWHVIACDINWEDAELYCAHTDERIESAYSEDDAKRY